MNRFVRFVVLSLTGIAGFSMAMPIQAQPPKKQKKVIGGVVSGGKKSGAGSAGNAGSGGANGKAGNAGNAGSGATTGKAGNAGNAGGEPVPSLPKPVSQGDERWSLTVSRVAMATHYAPVAKGEINFAALAGLAETDYSAGSLRLKPLPGYRLVALTMEAHNRQKSPMSLSWIPQEVQCSLSDSQAEPHPLLLVDSPTQGGKSKLVAPGGRLPFTLVFAIPTNSTPQVLSYTLVNFGIGERPETAVRLRLDGLSQP